MSENAETDYPDLKLMAIRFITCWQGILVTIVVLLIVANVLISPPAVVNYDPHGQGLNYEYTWRSTLDPTESYISGFYYIWPVIETHFGPGEPPGLYLQQGIYYRYYRAIP